MAVVFGIESSCDETAASICSDGKILSNAISSQHIHAAYGGVVPELAARDHIRNVVPVVELALEEARASLSEVEAFAYTSSPGLIGSLLVGGQFAKSVALATGKPLYAINHLHAHVVSACISHHTLEPPFLCLLVSGGHTQLVICQSWFDLQLVGQTLDDAAGEAFDKSARLLGFSYPGGKKLDFFAKGGNPKQFSLPISTLDNGSYSFSGLKTAVRYLVEKGKAKNPSFVEYYLHDLCASVQHAIVETLLHPIAETMQRHQLTTLALAGGVAANSYLREKAEDLFSPLGYNVCAADIAYCGDNAAMIAWLAEKMHREGVRSVSSFDTPSLARFRGY